MLSGQKLMKTENTGMYQALKQTFRRVFGEEPTLLFSAPGRTELIGNHTDHQGGMVLGASIDLETAAAVRPTDDGSIRLLSEGYPMCSVSLSDLGVQEEEKGSTAALIRGVAAGFAARGFRPVGFEAAVSSSVLPGSGLSSSASFEVLIGTVLNYLTKAELPAL
jgi:galactokinase